MTQKTALITGVTGQDGAYLSEYLLKKGYMVHGIKRRSSMFNTDRIDHLYEDPHVEDRKFKLHYGDLTDSMNLTRIIQETQPDEIYNLAAMSHVAVSFETPEYTGNADGLGTLRILEAVRLLGLTEKTRIYQASTSELYGMVQQVPQSEKTPFYPRSPYAVAKMYAYWITVNYREAYKMHASNGILFNHESPVRGETFVTRKITRAISRIALGNGFLESVYQDALEKGMRKLQIPFIRHKKLHILFDGKPLDKFFVADFTCYDSIILEIKAASFLHQSNSDQVINYLKATGYTVGLLVNFGESSMKWKLFIHTPNKSV